MKTYLLCDYHDVTAGSGCRLTVYISTYTLRVLSVKKPNVSKLTSKLSRNVLGALNSPCDTWKFAIKSPRMIRHAARTYNENFVTGA